MLKRIKSLLESGQNFAFETTLSTKSYVNLIEEAKQKEYQITLLFFWLHSSDLAVSRVKNRVKEGGHNIPENVIRRRYESGLTNFFTLYLPITDHWMFINNSGEPYEVIAEGSYEEMTTHNKLLWNQIRKKYHGH